MPENVSKSTIGAVHLDEHALAGVSEQLEGSGALGAVDGDFWKCFLKCLPSFGLMKDQWMANCMIP